MSNTNMITLSSEDLQLTTGGINWKKVGEYAAPVLASNPITMGLAIPLANKGAAVQGGVWAAGGALAAAKGGPEGMALGAAGGGLAGYYGALLSRDVPTT